MGINCKMLVTMWHRSLSIEGFDNWLPWMTPADLR